MVEQLLTKGQLAIVQGVGYPNPSRSHDISMAIWQSANVKLPRNDRRYGTPSDRDRGGTHEYAQYTYNHQETSHRALPEPLQDAKCYAGRGPDNPAGRDAPAPILQ